ncbi:SDR family oxidoreductase [Rhodococcus sp. NPDC058505]|uniref:SDR family oxidoreductase n=1 Tax=Rhodococcus sp. NPDC058505 TaxID=3346531 RepID=UPI003668C14F
MAVHNPADFTGKKILITGGTKGIGRVTAETFLAAGAEVTVCARSESESPIESGGRRAHFLSVDVRDADAVKEMVGTAAAAMGGLDVLINNAGGSPDADAATVSTRFVDKIVALNLLGPFYVAQAANAIMQQEAGGAIVNIGSVSAHDPQPGTAAYSAAKAGLLMLTKALALEWAPKVRVNHITTGLIRTEAAASVYGEDGGAAVTRTLPIGRMAVPSDIAGACLFLAGSLSSYVNGADIAVHGGGEYPARYLATHPEIG